jgi:hypothetical protein
MGLATEAFRSKIEISLDGGFSYVRVKELTSLDMGISSSKVSTRTYEDGSLDPQRLESITPTVSINMSPDDSDPAQKGLLQSLIGNPASFMVRVYASERAGDFLYIGRAFVDGGTLFSGSVGGNLSRSFNLGFMSFGMTIQ